MFSWWFSFVCFFGNTNPFYVSEYEGMQQQKAASVVSQRLPAIVEDCCQITDLRQFKLHLHEQLIRGDKGSELRNCPCSKFSCQGDNQITGESMCTFRHLGGAVLSFQMTGITLHNFFSSFESIAIACPPTIHGQIRSSRSCWRLNHISLSAENSKTAISQRCHSGQQDSMTARLQFVSFYQIIIVKSDITQIILSAANTLIINPKGNRERKNSTMQALHVYCLWCSCRLSRWSLKTSSNCLLGHLYL